MGFSLKKKLIIFGIAAGLLLGGGILWLAVGCQEGEEEILRARQVARFNNVKLKAAGGDVKSQYSLGVLYQRGLGVTRDARAAMRWYGRAALQGYARAQHALGRMYGDGDGVRTDYIKAAEYYTRAGGLGGLADAQFELGRLHFHGRGVPHDYSAAVKWLSKAAGQGHAPAQYLLGAILEEGWAGKPDFIEAYKWYSLAVPKAAQVLAVDSHFDTAAALDKLAKRMNRLQISRAKQKIAKWRPAAPSASIRYGGKVSLSHGEKKATEAHAQVEQSEPIHLKIAPLEVPVSGGGVDFATITVFLDIADEGAVAGVCQVSPRIRDAILQVMSARPVSLRRGQPVLEGVSGRLLKSVNRALGRETVSAVTAVAGKGEARGRATGIPFDTVSTCPGAEAAKAQ